MAPPTFRPARIAEGVERTVAECGDGAPLTTRALVSGWQRDTALADAFIAWLGRAPFEAYLWEMPPVRAGALGAPFECVLVDSPGLAAASPDPGPFAGKLSGRVNTFENLGGDAILVAPGPPDAGRFAHLGAFTRQAAPGHQRDLWREVGRAFQAELERTAAPRWLSTSGLGVHWLHVRIDERPKYVTHAPYRSS